MTDPAATRRHPTKAIPMHKPACTLLAAVLASALPALSPAQAAGDALAANTWLVVAIEDLDELRAKWDKSVLRDAWSSTEMETMRKRFDEALADASNQMLGETGVQPAELMAHFKAFTALALSNLRWDPEIEAFDSDALLVAEMGDEAREGFQRTFDTMLAKVVPEDAAKSADDLGDTRIFRIEYTADQSATLPEELHGLGIDMTSERVIEYAFTPTHFVLGVDSEGAVRDAVAAMQGLQPTLSANESWRRAQTMGDLAGDMMMWIDLPVLMRSGLENASEERDERMARALGVEEFGPMAVTATLTDTSIDSWAALGLNPQRAGLFKLLQALSPNPVASARQVPADAHSYTSWTLDGGVLFTAVMDLVEAAEPSVGMMARGYLQSIKGLVNYDIQNDLLANLQGEHFSYTRPLAADVAATLSPAQAAAESDSVAVLLNWRNGQAAGDALDRLFATISGEQFRVPLESGNSQGVRTWTLREEPEAPPPPLKPVFGLASQHLVITTSMSEMQDALRASQAAAAGPTLADSADFQAAMQAAQDPGLVLFSYSSSDSMASQLDNVRNVLQLTGAGDEAGMVPTGEWAKRYFGATFSSVVVEPEVLEARSQLILNK